MRETKSSRNFPWACMILLFFVAGCSHAVFTQSGTGGGGNQTSPIILTMHDTPLASITITSFEVQVTGAVLQPGNVPLLSTPQTVEFTQLQANSAFLSTTKVKFATFNSLTITFANPRFTILNDTGGAVTVPGGTCNAGASCVITPTISGASTMTFSGAPFPLTTAISQQNLLEVDANLNNIIQSDFSLNFGATGAGTVTNTQRTVVTGTTVIGSLTTNGAITSVGSNQFGLAASTGQALSIAVDNATGFKFAAANCNANNFTCLATGQLVSVNLNILTDGTLSASGIAFDDASGTQQLTGEIVALNATPPTSFTMVVHNEVPSISNVPVGTPVTVTICSTACFGTNNFFQLPSGLTFGSPSDLLVGQEVETRLSGTISTGPPVAFTTDRIMLDTTQVTATVSSVTPSSQTFIVNQLPSIFVNSQTNAFTQIQIQAGTSLGTSFQNLPTNDLTGLSVGHHAAVAGFLFNTISTSGSPTIVATVVRDNGP